MAAYVCGWSDDTQVIEAPETNAAANKFREDFGFDPETIDGCDVIGRCDLCDIVILDDGENWATSEESGDRMCEACSKI